MMKDIKCDTCGIKIGEIEEDALISSSEQGEDVVKYCRDCKHKIITIYFDDENQLINIKG